MMDSTRTLHSFSYGRAIAHRSYKFLIPLLFLLQQIGPGVEEINATIRNLRRQKDFELRLQGIDNECNKATKRNYFLWLEALHQLRQEKQLSERVEYFSETEFKKSRKSLLEKQMETKQNMSLGARRAKKPGAPVQRFSKIATQNLELLWSVTTHARQMHALHLCTSKRKFSQTWSYYYYCALFELAKCVKVFLL